VDRDGTPQNEERTAPPASSPKKRKNMRTESNGERTPYSNVAEHGTSPQQRINKTTNPTRSDGNDQGCDSEHKWTGFKDKIGDARRISPTPRDLYPPPTRSNKFDTLTHFDNFDTHRSYKSYFNVGTAGRGIALITRIEFTITR
jgi:hypothetical protein